MRKSLTLISFLLVIVLSIALAGCGGGGSTPTASPTPTLTPTPTPTGGLTDIDQINALLDLTEKAFLKQADVNACFTNPVDCGGHGKKTPQEVLNTFGAEGAPTSFLSFAIKDRVIPNSGDSRTVNFYILYRWTDTTTDVDTNPCNEVVVKTPNGWRLSTFGDVLSWFLDPRALRIPAAFRQSAQ